MNYTENYQLSQWVAGDRVLMEDFNENNKKMDTALTVIQQKLQQRISEVVKIAEATINTPTNRIDIDLSQIDLRNYARLMIYLSLPSDNNISYTVRLDNISSTVYSYTSSGSISELTHCGSFSPNGYLQSLELAASSTHYFMIAHDISSSGGELKDQAISIARSHFADEGPRSINFTRTSGKFIAGAYIRVYGICL